MSETEINQLKAENAKFREALTKISKGCDFANQVALQALDPEAYEALMGSIIDNALADW